MCYYSARSILRLPKTKPQTLESGAMRRLYAASLCGCIYLASCLTMAQVEVSQNIQSDREYAILTAIENSQTSDVAYGI